jgi:diphthine synthase
MVLYLVGLGLGDEKDITIRGLECVKTCKKLYLEYYTSVLGIDKQKLEEFYGVPIVVADREMVESQAEEIYSTAKDENIGFLVVGDPLCATTHVDLILRARNLGIKVEVVHNTSVMGAVASCGLPLYQYGYTVSIPFFEENWKPSSFYERIKYNLAGGMHTLCLVDIKVRKEKAHHLKGGHLHRMMTGVYGFAGERARLQRDGGCREVEVPAPAVHDGRACHHRRPPKRIA